MKELLLSMLVELAPTEKFCQSLDPIGLTRGIFIQMSIAAIYSGDKKRISDIQGWLGRIRDNKTFYNELVNDEILTLEECLEFASGEYSPD